jgi:hypothetical protein
MKKNSVFSKWVQKKNIADTAMGMNIPELQKAFITENKIRFAIATRAAVLPPEIAAIKEKEITDSISGNRFFLLKTAD